LIIVSKFESCDSIISTNKENKTLVPYLVIKGVRLIKNNEKNTLGLNRD
jgi:hypothetical protein